MTDETRTASVERPFDPNGQREPRETETVSSAAAASRDASDADGDSDGQKTSATWTGASSVQGVRGRACERSRTGHSDEREARGELSSRAGPVRSFSKPSSTDGEDDVIADTFEQSFAKLAAMDDDARGDQKISRRARSSETFPFQTTITTSTTDKYHPQPILHPRGAVR